MEGYRFGPYEVDLRNQQVVHGERVLQLRPKTWGVLLQLVRRAGELVTTDELLDAVWPETVVGSELPGVSVRELRKVLGDDPRQPRYIETVSRRGYRFIAEVHAVGVDSVPSAVASLPPVFVGRSFELAQLRVQLQETAGGARRLVFVTGEPGIGKTALVDVFLREVADGTLARVLIGRGQCMEQHSEAFLPVLDVLLSICSADSSGEVIEQIRRHAPRWLAELPAVVSPREREVLRRQAGALTPERMLRTLALGLEACAQRRTLVLVLEDAHWSDHSTVDFLRYLAERSQAARLLAIVTYRPIDAALRAHPLRQVKQGLLARRRAAELPLDFLAPEHVRRFVDLRWPGLEQAPELASWLFERTDGSPLFLHALADQLIVLGHLREGEDGWRLGPDYARVGVPPSVREFILQKMEDLPPADRDLLDVASTVGTRFTAAAVAAALDTGLVEVDEACRRLAMEKELLRIGPLRRWPDGTVCGEYEFAHSLYRQAIHGRMTPARLQTFHRRIGCRLEQGFAGREEEVSAELASHFDRAGDHERARRYHRQAAALAAERHGYAEAAEHLEAARATIELLPRTEAVMADATQIGSALGSALMATRGYAAEPAKEAFEWALRCARQAPESPATLVASIGLCTSLITRAELDRARALATQIVALGDRLGLSGPLAALCRNPLGQVCFYRGEVEAARRELAAGRQMFESDPGQSPFQQFRALLWIDPYVSCLNQLALVLALCGQAEQARETAACAAAHARALGHPFTLISVLTHGALLGFVLADWKHTQQLAEEARDLAADCGFPFWVASAGNVLAHATAMQGDPRGGVVMLERSMEMWEATGTRLGEVIYRLMLAEARLEGGEAEAAESLLRDALARALASGERVVEAEVYRMLGHARLAQGDRDGARGSLQQALEVARRQGAVLWEARAAADLARLARGRARTPAERARCG